MAPSTPPKSTSFAKTTGCKIRRARPRGVHDTQDGGAIGSPFVLSVTAAGVQEVFPLGNLLAKRCGRRRSLFRWRLDHTLRLRPASPYAGAVAARDLVPG